MSERPRPKQRSAEAYFEVAVDMLQGPGSFRSLTIAALCHRLKVTKGSFYHHFEGLDDFINRLLAYWEDKQQQSITAPLIDAGAPNKQLDQLAKMESEAPHPLENAFRSWGGSNPIVAQTVARIDAVRVNHYIRVLSAFIHVPGRVTKVAVMAQALFIGLQHMEPRRNADQIRDVLLGYFHEVVDTPLDNQT